MGIAKTYDYVLVLKPATNTVVYDWISQFLLVFAFSVNAYSAIAVHSLDYRLVAGAFAFGIAVAGLYSRIEGKPFRIGLFIAFAAWLFLYHQWLLALLYAVCGILEKQVKFKQEVGIDKNGLAINSFPAKEYLWPEVRNMIIKDGIVTIDLPRNKFIQQELENEIPVALEKEVNDFCRRHLNEQRVTTN
jgi:hypothetical protein